MLVIVYIPSAVHAPRSPAAAITWADSLEGGAGNAVNGLGAACKEIAKSLSGPTGCFQHRAGPNHPSL